LPLTYKDAIAFAGLFPLCLVWTPVQKGSKDYKQARELGIAVSLPGGKELASLIVPTAFIPGTFPCPALLDQKTCGIHRDKPSRCKTMPFYPYREERFQGEFLRPREGWECDVSQDAPLVYDGKRVTLREDFDREKNDLLEQVPVLRRYAEYMFKYVETLPAQLWLASMQSGGGRIVASLSSFLTAIRHPEADRIAAKQVAILDEYAARTAGDPKLAEFHSYYSAWSKEMAHMSRKTLQG
jgi:Fe-S-cluster containining protein